MNKFLASSIVLCAILLGGCAEPAVHNGTLLQYPTARVQNLYVDTSGTSMIAVTNAWKRKIEPEFKVAVPVVFAEYGVNAQTFELKDESRLHSAGVGDYILRINFASGTYGSYGTTSSYTLDLFSARSNAKIWSGSIAGSGSATIATQNLGEVIARNIAISMNASHLFSDDFIKAHPAATDMRQAPPALSGKAQEAFEKFKTLKPPKAFVSADGGNYVYEGWQADVDGTPAERALAKCEALKYQHCHVISDGIHVF